MNGITKDRRIKVAVVANELFAQDSGRMGGFGCNDGAPFGGTPVSGGYTTTG